MGEPAVSISHSTTSLGSARENNCRQDQPISTAIPLGLRVASELP